MESIIGNLTLPGNSQAPAASTTGAGPGSHADAGPYRTVTPHIRPQLPLFRLDSKHWRSTEQYRIIRTKLAQHPAQPRVIGVSSAAPGDGKTINAANIAAAIAMKQDTRVLLVDGDFRRANMAWALGVPPGPGLVEVLSSACTLQDAIVRLAGFSNLYFLSAGQNRNSPAELLDSPAWRACSELLRRNFEYIVLDTPPIGLVADYDLLQTACDGVIVIVRPEHTRRDQLFHALESIPAEKMLGVVVNCARESLFWKRHDYYYYYY